MKGLLINKYLHKILTEDEELSQMVNPDNIKALILSPTNYPFVSFKRNSIETLYSKDIPYEDRVNVDIIAVSDNYTESLNIAQRIREILEYHAYKDSEDNILITYMVMKDSGEDTISNAFVQTLNFEFHIQDLN